jgi:hypothetical protein
MGKYSPLGEFLRAKRLREVPMTFAEIERITGSKLPPKAQHQRAWWSNNPSNNVMTKVWLEAGYETERVDMAGRKLVFRRVGKAEKEAASAPAPKSYATEDGRHPAWGALKGTLRIAPGVDLTEPAFPEWADLLDKKYGPEVR